MSTILTLNKRKNIKLFRNEKLSDHIFKFINFNSPTTALYIHRSYWGLFIFQSGNATNVCGRNVFIKDLEMDCDLQVQKQRKTLGSELVMCNH